MSEVNLQTGGFCGYSFGKESLALKNPPSLWQRRAACQMAEQQVQTTQSWQRNELCILGLSICKALTSTCPADP